MPERAGVAEAVSALALVLFVGFYGLTRMESEPFPSFTLPSFGSFASSEASRSVTAPTITMSFSDGTTSGVEPQALLGPVGQKAVIVLSRQFREGLGEDGELVVGPKRLTGLDRMIRVLPAGQVWDGTSSRAQDPRTRAWLLERAKALFPGRQLADVTITWVKTTYDRRTRAVLASQVLSRVTVRVAP